MEENLNYESRTGRWTDNGGTLIATGFAGHGKGLNNPEMENVRFVGALPRGVYVVGPWHTHPRLGPMVCRLTQISGDTFGRGDFYCHGEDSHPETNDESLGCTVVKRPGRQKIHDLNPVFVHVW